MEQALNSNYKIAGSIDGQVSRRSALKILGLTVATGSIAALSSGCADLQSTIDSALHDYKIIVKDKDNKVYVLKHGRNTREEDLGYRILGDNRDALIDALEQSGMSEKDVAGFRDNVYCEKPNANIAGEILYRALKSNPETKKTAETFGIGAEKYLDKKTLAIIIGGVVIGVVASSGGGSSDGGPTGPPGFGG